MNEYEHYIATCPYSYFSALAVEWRKDGRFRGQLDTEFKQWLIGKDGFHGDWVTDKNKFYHRFARMAKARGEQVPDIGDWVIPQDMIPIHTKYQKALFSYQRRNRSDAFLGKVALMGAWAVRARLQRPLLDMRLKGGIEEVNERFQRHVEDGDTFEVDKVYEIYKKIFYNSRLTDEGYFSAGITLVGLSIRKGYLQETMDVLERMRKRFDGKEDLHVFLRGLVRERHTEITQDYLAFTQLVVTHFTNALANEEFPRTKIPEIMLVVAEAHRRLGNLSRAYDWYLALSDLEETQKLMREEIRESGGMPSVDAPYAMLLGWRADEYRMSLIEQGLVHPGTISGPDTKLLNAIVVQGLGTLDYVNTSWQPRSDGNQAQLAVMLEQIGLAVMDFRKRAGKWPSRIGELWLYQIIPDRNAYNRFHCPVTGAKLAYTQLSGELEKLHPRTVVVATTKAVPTNQGDRYGAFLADLSVRWSETPFKAGEIAP